MTYHDKKQINALCFLALCLSMIAIALASFDLSQQALIVISAACIAMITSSKKLSSNYLSVSVVFFLFIILYGIFGPLAALSEKGLSPVFVRPYLVSNYIIGFSLAIMGATCAIAIKSLFSQTQPPFIHEQRFALGEIFDTPSVTSVAFIFALSASVSEIVNIANAGGVSMLFGGKAAYQGAISDMYGSIPSEWFLYAGAAMLGLSFHSGTIKPGRTIYFLLLSFPIILSWALLGRRFEIVACIIIFFISLRTFNPVRRIKLRYAGLAIAAYVAVSSLYIIRPWVYPAYIYGDIGIIFDNVSDIEIWIAALNPSDNEFQAPFANFNTQAVLRMMPEEQNGLTYLGGFAEPIPRLIWPDKPISATYQFRDTYFSSWSERGSIAGTGFSSILEAYINFSWAGIFIVFFTVGSMILWIETLVIRHKSVWTLVFYSLMIPFAIFFSRKSFGNPVVVPAIFSLLCFLSYSAVRGFRMKSRLRFF